MTGDRQKVESELPDELVGLSWRYLHDPQFHALVEIAVRKEYRPLLDALGNAERQRDEYRDLLRRIDREVASLQEDAKNPGAGFDYEYLILSPDEIRTWKLAAIDVGPTKGMRT